MFYLIRHGSTDYSQRNTKIYQGFGVNLAPLSAKGAEEIRQTAKDSRLAGTSLILSSPYSELCMKVTLNLFLAPSAARAA